MYRRVFGDHDTIPRFLTAQAERLGDKPLLRFAHDGIDISYRALVAASEHGSSRLRGEHGIEAGMVAAILLPNGSAFIHAWFACLFGGIVDIPINHEFRKTALLFGLATAETRVIFTGNDGFAALVDPEVIDYLNRVSLIVVTEEFDRNAVQLALRRLAKPPTVVSLAELCAEGPQDHAWAPLPGSSLASIRYTSGTTGLPKGIMQSHLHMLNKSAVHNGFLEFAESDILYSPFPLHHNLASINGLIGTLQAGATMVSASRFSASSYWRDVAASKATLGHILHPLLTLLLKQPPADADRGHACRLLWTAWPNREFEQRFGTRLLHTFAIGEVGAVSYRISNQDESSRAAGIPLPEIEVCIVDALDRPLAPGATGEITLRPREPHRVMLGYVGNLPATMRAFRNLWFHTGDAGYVDAAGELHFMGRIGDTIRRRGVNISSEQIEGELNRHENVLECAVIGVPSELGEEDIQAVVKWRMPPDDEAAALLALAQFLLGRLPRQYVPRYFEVIDELPKTNTGKTQKNLLRARQPQPRRWDREAGR